ncbi:MAG: heparin lyase I family protein [Rhodocyclaceae bacterium]|nr:heparin lyase I family protein [Rhodocyclaceae bacterium]
MHEEDFCDAVDAVRVAAILGLAGIGFGLPVAAIAQAYPAPGSTRSAGGVSWSCDFENGYCNLLEQSKLGDAPPSARRSSLVATARSGKLALRLHTEAGDNGVHGSGTWERDDLSDAATAAYCNQDQEEWWAHSVLFPSDFYFPRAGQEAGVIFAFHQTSGSGLSNFELQTIPGVGLRLRGHGGPTINGGEFNIVMVDPYGAPAGSITKNVWYDFVYHIRWSSTSTGLVEAWLNDKKVGTYEGATLYGGLSCYLKVQNYHGPWGVASSVIHDRIVRGTSASAVSITPLRP